MLHSTQLTILSQQVEPTIGEKVCRVRKTNFASSGSGVNTFTIFPSSFQLLSGPGGECLVVDDYKIRLVQKKIRKDLAILSR
jgi:hypothetical protein